LANIVELIIRGNDQSARAIASSVKNLEGMNSVIGSLSRNLAGIVSVGSLVALGRSAIQLGSDLNDASQKFGVAASELSKLQFVAKMSGVELEDLGGAFKFMAKAIAESENPTSDAAIAFKAMGIGMEDLRKKSPNELFMTLADRFSEMKDGANKTALAMAIFGRSGANILPVLRDGAAGIQKLKDEAVKMGAALTEEQIKKLDDYGDRIDAIGLAAKTTAGKLTIDLVDGLKALWDGVEKYGPRIEAFYARVFGGEVSEKSRGIKSGKIADILVPNPEPPTKIEPPNSEAIKKANADRKKLEEDYQKRQLKLLQERADVLQDFYGDAAELAKIAGEEDIKRGEAAIKIEKDRLKYAEELRGTMDMMSLAYDPEMDLVEGMQELGKVTTEVSPLVQRMMDEWYQKTQAMAALYDTVFRGEDGLFADMAYTAIGAFNAMTDALVNFVMTGKNNFRDFANSVIADIMRIAVRQAIVQPIAQGLMGAFGFATAPPRALGGPVSGGSAYLVGERGPELFVPSTSGSIVPNGGSGNVTVNIRNEGGEKVMAKSASASFDLSGTVIDIVLDGLNRNVHGLRTALGGA